jgi:hypothetical protein
MEYDLFIRDGRGWFRLSVLLGSSLVSRHTKPMGRVVESAGTRI